MKTYKAVILILPPVMSFEDIYRRLSRTHYDDCIEGRQPQVIQHNIIDIPDDVTKEEIEKRINNEVPYCLSWGYFEK